MEKFHYPKNIILGLGDELVQVRNRRQFGKWQMANGQSLNANHEPTYLINRCPEHPF